MGSPIPNKEVQEQMDFNGAIKAVLDGKKVTKLEWNSPAEFMVMAGEYLCVHHSGDDSPTYHRLIIRESDLKGTDWVIVKNPVV